MQKEEEKKVMAEFEKDGSGVLEKPEAKAMLDMIMAKLGVVAEGEPFPDDQFDAMFLLMDQDGTLAESELAVLVQQSLAPACRTRRQEPAPSPAPRGLSPAGIAELAARRAAKRRAVEVAARRAWPAPRSPGEGYRLN